MRRGGAQDMLIPARLGTVGASQFSSCPSGAPALPPLLEPLGLLSFDPSLSSTATAARVAALAGSGFGVPAALPRLPRAIASTGCWAPGIVDKYSEYYICAGKQAAAPAAGAERRTGFCCQITCQVA